MVSRAFSSGVADMEEPVYGDSDHRLQPFLNHRPITMKFTSANDPPGLLCLALVRDDVKDTIAKVDWLSAQRCPAMAWYGLRAAPAAPSEAEQFRMRQGREIGLRARQLYVGGILVPQTARCGVSTGCSDRDLIGRRVATSRDYHGVGASCTGAARGGAPGCVGLSFDKCGHRPIRGAGSG